MKRIITLVALALGFTLTKAQTASVTINMESFTLAANSAYTNTNSVPFTTNNVSFQHQWNSSFSFWSGGFAVTNIHDSSTATFSNLYGVKPFMGYNGSNQHAVGQAGGIINLSAPSTTVEGFYITNTTYAYKTIRNGNAFSRKFGDTTGTGSGTTIPQGSYPDFFKVTAKGYNNGSLLTDSVVFYLADYRFSNNAQDYIVNNWQWVNTSTLGEIDSLVFFMYSSDNGQFGPNTPLFFAIDNFTVKYSTASLEELSTLNNVRTYPNPIVSELYIENVDNEEFTIQLLTQNGLLIKEQVVNGSMKWDLNDIAPGFYMVKMSTKDNYTVKKFIKH